MRITRSSFVIALWLTGAATGAAQQNAPPPEPDQNTGVSTLAGIGQFDFGARGTVYDENSDEALYRRYRDLRHGPFLEDFHWENANDSVFWDVRTTHFGYRDQQYAANYNRFGKLKASFEFSQIPLFFSENTRTAYRETSDGVLSLDGFPQQVQTRAVTSAIYNAVASAFELRHKRSIADFRLVYSATDHVDLSAYFKNIEKGGDQPWAGTFGFGDAVELPGPIDTRTTDVGVAAEWIGNRGEARVGYDGSFFRNNIGTLIWDNPLRSTDSPTAGPARGRMALWPDNNLNAGSVSGLAKLPWNSQATGYVSVGRLSQDEALIPFTINSALAAPPLDRQTADASAHVTATAFTYNLRPVPNLWLFARFRSYDFDNDTPVFHVANTVSFDTTVAPFAPGGTSPYGFTRKLLDLDASWTPWTFTAFRVGYSRDTLDETFRTFATTTENIGRVSADTAGLGWLTLRFQYDYSRRSGSGLDEQTLDDIGEQTSLRQFDISNRDLHRFSTIVIATPAPSVSLNGTAFTGRDNRSNTGFGLLSYDTDGFSAGFDYVPGNAVSLGALYEYERYSSLQKSREANPGPQFNDPTRDWTTSGADRAHTITASADFLELWPNTDVRFAYDYVHGSSRYIYGLAPNTTLPPVSQLPQVRNARNRLTADLRHMITSHFGIGVVYWYEKFTINDFAFNPATLNTVAQPLFISLQYTFFPYAANTIWARGTYRW